MQFETAGIEVAPWLPPLVAFAISLCTSMGGVSGAFLLLPFQVSVLGFTSPAVSATNQVFNVVATPSGVYRYLREGRMVWPLAWVVVLGTLPGVAVGALLRILWLPDARDFKLFMAAVLLLIGLRLARDALRSGGPPEPGGGAVVPVRVPGRIAYTYGNGLYSARRGAVFAVAAVVGVIGGAYGIGGGAIIAPILVDVFALPVHTVAGAALLGTLVTSVAGVAFYHVAAPFFPHVAVAPDWGLGLLFGLGGAAGMYCGAWLQRFVPARALKLLLVLCLVGPAIGYVYGFLQGA